MDLTFKTDKNHTYNVGDFVFNIKDSFSPTKRKRRYGMLRRSGKTKLLTLQQLNILLELEYNDIVAKLGGDSFGQNHHTTGLITVLTTLARGWPLSDEVSSNVDHLKRLQKQNLLELMKNISFVGVIVEAKKEVVVKISGDVKCRLPTSEKIENGDILGYKLIYDQNKPIVVICKKNRDFLGKDGKKFDSTILTVRGQNQIVTSAHGHKIVRRLKNVKSKYEFVEICKISGAMSRYSKYNLKISSQFNYMYQTGGDIPIGRVPLIYVHLL